MPKPIRILTLMVLVFAGTVFAAPADAAVPRLLPVPGPCVQGVLPSGALSLICVPAAGWNGDLVVYAHGYVAFNEPLGFYNLTLGDGTDIPTLVQSLGYAFATTSYRQNGLAILEGVEDVKELVAAFPAVAGRSPARTYMTGPSEGGIITALLVERAPELFSGGLSLCGPVGDFRKQIDYWGDFRVLFDYFFPTALPPTAITIPDTVIENWESTYKPAIDALVTANPNAAGQLIRTSGAAVDPADPTTINKTTLGLLWYNVFATNDGKAKLGGNPFDNTTRIYRGSENDLALNQGVTRYSADPQALVAMIPYNTSGRVRIPLVTMHTTGDEIIPFWHQVLYRKKLLANGSFGVIQIPIARYGHCNFTAEEVLVGFALLVLQTTGRDLQYVPEQYDLAPVRAQIERARAEFAARSLDQ